MNLFFLAAGLGTRFKPLTLKMPKPAIPFLNVPLGYYNFRFLQNLNHPIHSFVVNTHHLPRQIESLYSSQKFISSQAVFSNEPDIILGTAGGVKKAESLFTPNEPILMMNADEIIFTKNNDFINLALDQHKKNNSLATLVVMPHEEAGKKFGGIWCDKNNRVRMIGKSCDVPDTKALHYVGVIILSWDVLSLIQPNKELNIFYDVLINHLDQIQIYKIEADWYETGNQIDYLKATQTVLKKITEIKVSDEYKNVFDFINQYDAAKLIQSKDSISLISNKVTEASLKLKGTNVISADALMESNLNIENEVRFSDQVLK